MTARRESVFGTGSDNCGIFNRCVLFLCYLGRISCSGAVIAVHRFDAGFGAGSFFVNGEIILPAVAGRLENLNGAYRVAAYLAHIVFFAVGGAGGGGSLCSESVLMILIMHCSIKQRLVIILYNHFIPLILRSFIVDIGQRYTVAECGISNHLNAVGQNYFREPFTPKKCFRIYQRKAVGELSLYKPAAFRKSSAADIVNTVGHLES